MTERRIEPEQGRAPFGHLDEKHPRRTSRSTSAFSRKLPEFVQMQKLETRAHALNTGRRSFRSDGDRARRSLRRPCRRARPRALHSLLQDEIPRPSTFKTSKIVWIAPLRRRYLRSK
jgi:hypothetical protein